MKKFISTLSVAAVVFSAAALPKAVYVKQGDTYTKYNFGVASDMNFSNGGKKLTITGYSEVIDLDKIDYITFTPPVQQSMTPAEQKSKMIAVGEEINKRIDLYNVQDALLMYKCFTRSDRTNGWYPFSRYDIPREYWDVFNEFGNHAIHAAAGNVAAIAKVREGASNIYKFEDYTGIYYANTDTHTWERIASADYFEMRFPAGDGDDYMVRLTPSEKFTSYVTPDYSGQLPENIDILLAKGSVTIATGRIKSELKQDENISFETEMTCGRYTAQETMKIVNNAITSDITVYVGDEKFLSTKRSVDGKNLLVYDEMYDAFHDASHWHDADDNCMGDDYTALTAHFIRAEADADVLGLLQAKVKAFNFNKVYTHFRDMDAAHYYEIDLGDGRYIDTGGKIIGANSDNSILAITYDDEEFVNDMEKYLNNYADASFYYDNKPDLQGYLAFETMEDVWENTAWCDDTYAYTVVDGYLVRVQRNKTGGVYGPWYYTIYDDNDWYNNENVEVDADKVIFPEVINEVDFNLTPLLTFPDLTSFAFEDFFTESSFRTLINDYEDIISTYSNIVGR